MTLAKYNVLMITVFDRSSNTSYTTVRIIIFSTLNYKIHLLKLILFSTDNINVKSFKRGFIISEKNKNTWNTYIIEIFL